MKTRLLSLATAVLTAVLFLLPSTSMAALTTLLSQDFSGGTFPPTTNQVGSGSWTANKAWDGNQNYQTSTPGGWSRDGGGATGANGCALCWEGGTYNMICGGTTFGPMVLTSPNIACSASDSQFVDFDLFFPQNYYHSTGSYPQMAISIDIISGTTVLKTLKDPSDATMGDCTFYSGTTPPGVFPSSGYYGTSYWRHYHMALPFGVTSQNIIFKVYQSGSCTYTYWYNDNIAFDNVVITDQSFNNITVVGPTMLSFSNQPLGTTSNPQYVKIKNTANRLFNLTNYLLAGSSPSQFVITRAPASIAVGVTDSIGFAYAPTITGLKSATGQFTALDDGNTTPIISLNGFGVAPNISIPPNLILFAKKHARFRQTIIQSFAVTALGPVPLHISPPPATYIGGDYPNEYTILRYPTNPILGGQTDTFTIMFTAMIEGSTSATLFIASDASNGTQQVPLHGVGVLPRLVINGVYNPFANSISMPFDSVNVGTQKCKQMSFYNPGTDTLLLLKNFLSSKDYDFSITPMSGTDTILAPEQTKMMSVCFTPLRNGFRTATFRAATNIPITFPVNPPMAPNTFGPDTSGFSVVLTGTGVPFGSLSITGPSSDSSVVGTEVCWWDTVWNIGSATVMLTKEALTGGDSAQFRGGFTSLILPTPLAPGSGLAFELCGTPKTAGNHTTLYTLTATQGDGSPITTPFPISVFGQRSCDTATFTTPLPAVTCVCSNGDTATITVTNCGDVATAYAAAIQGLNAADYSIVGSATSPMESAGKVATFKVAYKPTTRGNSVANFVVTGGPGATVALTGKGGAPNISGTATAPITSTGSTSANFTVTVTNSGECPWTPGAPVLPPGSAFTYTGIVGETTTAIGPGKTATLTFKFKPTSAGAVNTTVTFPNASCTSIPAAAVTLDGGTAGVSEVTAQLGYSIEQNYPNPFSHETSISMTLPKDDLVKLTIVDQTGHVVRTVLNQRMAAGTFNVTMNAGELASGTYYYQMSTSAVTLTRQMVIVK